MIGPRDPHQLMLMAGIEQVTARLKQASCKRARDKSSALLQAVQRFCWQAKNNFKQEAWHRTTRPEARLELTRFRPNVFTAQGSDKAAGMVAPVMSSMVEPERPTLRRPAEGVVIRAIRPSRNRRELLGLRLRAPNPAALGKPSARLQRGMEYLVALDKARWKRNVIPLEQCHCCTVRGKGVVRAALIRDGQGYCQQCGSQALRPGEAREAEGLMLARAMAPSRGQAYGVMLGFMTKPAWLRWRQWYWARGQGSALPDKR